MILSTRGGEYEIGELGADSVTKADWILSDGKHRRRGPLLRQPAKPKFPHALPRPGETIIKRIG